MENKFSVFDSPNVLEGIVLPSYKNCVLFMHPSDMKMLKLGKNHLVLLKSDEKKLILRSLPCPSIPPSSVVLPSLNLFRDNLKNSVTVEVYNQLIGYADRIILTFDRYKPFMESENFRRHLRANLDKLYLKEDLILCISYLGYDCRCVVKRIIGLSGENISDDSLIFKELTLESSFFCSTPKHSKASKYLLPGNIENVSNRNVDGLSEQFYVIHENTRILFEREEDKNINKVHFQDICGLKEQIESLKSLINPVLNQNSIPVGNCRGVILIGQSGTGKSIMVEALGNEFHLPVISLNNITFNRNKEDFKVQLQNLFKKAKDNVPSILFIDNIDLFCKDHDISSSLDKSETASLLSTMLHHLMNSTSGIIVIGTARSISDVDSCLRKPGLLETEIYFETPSVADRKEILSKILSKIPHTLNQEQMSEVSECTHGFTGGDLSLLCDEGIIFAQFRADEFNELVHFEDLKQALKVVKPSAMAEYKFEMPKIKWSDIGGMHEVKKELTEMVNLKFARKLKEWKMPTHRGILLYGPPGCSKTMIAAALASESNFNFISVKGPELFRKYVGESENAMSQLFIKARSAAPCIIFFDEIETMSSMRGSTTGNSNVSDRLLNQLLVTIDGIDVLESPVYIIAATNRPEKIDESLLRPGRFDKLIYVPLPDSSARKEIIEKCIRNLPVSKDISVPDLVELTEGYTGAEVVEVCDEAASSALEDSIISQVPETDLHTAFVTRKHFHTALEHVKPKTTKEMLKSYEAFQVQRKCNLFNS